MRTKIITNESIWVSKNGKRTSLKNMSNPQIKKAMAEIEKLWESWDGSNPTLYFTWGRWKRILSSELTARLTKPEIIDIYSE